jgi:hypothetical protein
MQFAQEIIDNLEKRSRLYKILSLWRSRMRQRSCSRSVGYAQSHLTTFKLKTILLICLIGFTSLLVRQTLQVQHSCNPMIHWFRELPTECQVAVKTNFDGFDNFSYPRKEEIKTPKQTNKKQTTNDLPDTTKTESKNQIVKVVEKTAVSAVEIAKDNPIPTSIATGALVSAGVMLVTAIPPLAVIAGLITGLAVWLNIK